MNIKYEILKKLNSKELKAINSLLAELRASPETPYSASLPIFSAANTRIPLQNSDNYSSSGFGVFARKSRQAAAKEGFRRGSSPSAKKVTGPAAKKVLGQNIVFIARDTAENKLVAMATLVPIHQFTGFIGRVEDVVVNENYRGKGIGLELLKNIISAAKSKKMRHLELTSNPKRIAANKLYLKLGFAIRETNVYRLKLAD